MLTVICQNTNIEHRIISTFIDRLGLIKNTSVIQSYKTREVIKIIALTFKRAYSSMIVA